MERREDKQPVPQIVEQTGVTADYLNEILFWLAETPKKVPERVQLLLETRNGKVMRRYEERFSPEKYLEVVTDKNRECVAQLNAIADDVNQKASEGRLTLPYLQALARRAWRIVYDRELEEDEESE